LNSTRYQRAESFPLWRKGDARENQKEEDHKDHPDEYLLFAVAAIIVIAVTALGAFVILIRN